ncbi:MAG: hypothetical protein MSJ41_04265 [Erysipelotrichaceae bacterium]|nr:hypothetical protein [Erysipelotrichaceae bacterium]
MVTIGVTAIISTVVYALLGTFINILVKGSTNVAANILSFVLDKLEGNTLDAIVGIVKFPIDIGSVIRVVAFGLIGIILVSGIIKSFTANITGAKTESPWQIAFNCFLAVLLIVLFFGTGKNGLLAATYVDGKYTYTFNSVKNGLLSQIAQIFAYILEELIPTVKNANSTVANGNVAMNFQFNPADYIGLLILSAGLFGSIIGGAISILERFVQLAVFYILGPVALALYADSGTRSSAKQWIFGFITQYAAICISLMMWAVAMQSLDGYLSMQNETIATELGSGALTIVLFSIAGNSEELLNVIGFKTMSPMDAARTVQNGVSDALRAKSMISGAAKPFIKPAEKFAQKLGEGMKKQMGLPSENMAKTMRGVEGLVNSPTGMNTKDENGNKIEDKKLINPVFGLSQAKANNILDKFKEAQANGVSSYGNAEDLTKALIQGSHNVPNSSAAVKAANAASAKFGKNSQACIAKMSYIDKNGEMQEDFCLLGLGNKVATQADVKAGVTGPDGKTPVQVGDTLGDSVPTVITGFDKNGNLIDASSIVSINGTPTSNTISSEHTSIPGTEEDKKYIRGNIANINNSSLVDDRFGSFGDKKDIAKNDRSTSGLPEYVFSPRYVIPAKEPEKASNDSKKR